MDKIFQNLKNIGIIGAAEKYRNFYTKNMGNIVLSQKYRKNIGIIGLAQKYRKNIGFLGGAQKYRKYRKI